MTDMPARMPRPDLASLAQPFREFPRHLFRDATSLLEEDDNLFLAVAFTPDPDFNYVYGGSVGPDASERLAATLARLRAWNIPFQWVVPSTAADFSAVLSAHGVPKVGDVPIMTLDLNQLNPADAQVQGLSLHRVLTASDMHDWVALSVEVFGYGEVTARRLNEMGRGVLLDPDSRVHCYLGRLNGEPVGTALNVYGKELVSVWAIGTVEQARRHGIGTALTTGPLLEAREAGYGVAMLLSTEAGFPVYTRLGWEVQATCPVHVESQG